MKKTIHELSKNKRMGGVSLNNLLKILWMTTVLVFVVQCYPIVSGSGEISKTFIATIIGNIVISLIIFISGSLSIQGKTIASLKLRIGRPIAIMIPVTYFLVISIPTYSYYQQKSDPQPEVRRNIKNTPQKVIPTLYKTPPNQELEVKYDSNDPIIDCISTANHCQGMSIRVRQSQCSNITCCQIGNSWIVYETREKCDDARRSVINNVDNPNPTRPNNNVTPTPTRSQYYPSPTKTPTNNPTPNQELKIQCMDRCNSIGAANERLITERAKAMGTISTNFYTEEIYDNNQWVNTCKSNCD